MRPVPARRRSHRTASRRPRCHRRRPSARRASSPGSQTATVTWTAPGSTGGSPITGYTITSSPGGLTGSAGASATSGTVAGLVFGTTYTFTVVATNAAGPGAPSQPSNSVTPTTVPSAPTIGTASIVRGSQTATVTWTGRAASGGSPITGYTITSSPGGLTGRAGASATSARVGAGVRHRLTPSPWVATMRPVPARRRSHRTASPRLGARRADHRHGEHRRRQARRRPSPGPRGQHGGRPITGYTITSSPGRPDRQRWRQRHLGHGGRAGVRHHLHLHRGRHQSPVPRAVAAIENSVTPTTVPSAPPSARRASSPAARRRPSLDRAGQPPAARRSRLHHHQQSGGLTAALAPAATSGHGGRAGVRTTYTFTVVATNAAGPGAPSQPSNSITPTTVPGAPTIPRPLRAMRKFQVRSRRPASNGGSTILQYTATCGSQSASGPSSPITVSGLTNGTSYTCTVTATNAMRHRSRLSAVEQRTPTSVPGAPTIARRASSPAARRRPSPGPRRQHRRLADHRLHHHQQFRAA